VNIDRPLKQLRQCALTNMSNTINPNDFGSKNAALYDERWRPLAPMRDSLHLQSSLILQSLPADARILCVGAGTGAEVVALARQFAGWRFLALDISEPMLAICRERVAEEGIAHRCAFHVGYLHDLPQCAPFDAATSILVSHFIVERAQRTAFFRELANRLCAGGFLITADLCVAATGTHQNLLGVWQQMMRHAGGSNEQIEAMLASYGNEVSLLNISEMEALLVEAGFSAPVHFSQSLLIHAWYAQRDR
jgi:tRNA (cmo5U34)-methyltransferase